MLSCNDEYRKTDIVNGQKHYRKYFATGRYLTLLGQISNKRGIYQSNLQTRSICPLEQKLGFINDYVSFAAAEHNCYRMASMTLSEFVKHCKKWTLMKPSEDTVKRVLDFLSCFSRKERDAFLEGLSVAMLELTSTSLLKVKNLL